MIVCILQGMSLNPTPSIQRQGRFRCQAPINEPSSTLKVCTGVKTRTHRICRNGKANSRVCARWGIDGRSDANDTAYNWIEIRILTVHVSYGRVIIQHLFVGYGEKSEHETWSIWTWAVKKWAATVARINGSVGLDDLVDWPSVQACDLTACKLRFNLLWLSTATGEIWTSLRVAAKQHTEFCFVWGQARS
jgi:hypothetical protein